jgi:hypothetical protein
MVFLAVSVALAASLRIAAFSVDADDATRTAAVHAARYADAGAARGVADDLASHGGVAVTALGDTIVVDQSALVSLPHPGGARRTELGFTAIAPIAPFRSARE